MIGIIIICLVCFLIGFLTGVVICETNAERTVDRIIKEKNKHDKEEI